MVAVSDKLRRHFGNLAIYLFDQILRGRFDAVQSILDVGCGSGRNLAYFLREGFEVWGLDRDAQAVAASRNLAQQISPNFSVAQLRIAEADAIPFPQSSFDAVICSAVLHFANDQEHFHRMLDTMWNVLSEGGLFFARLASTIGMEEHLQLLQGRHYQLPGGTTWFLVDEGILLECTNRLGGTLLDPIKTTNVQNKRCMTTWCLMKNSEPPTATSSA